jgi:hypothetical protein
MSKEKLYEKLIPRIYKRKYEDMGMYFFVSGQRSIVPAISVEKALINYFRYIGEEDYNIESAIVTFFRLQKEYYESTQTDN